MLVTETTGIKLLPKIIVLNPKDGAVLRFPARFHAADFSINFQHCFVASFKLRTD